MFKSTAQKEKEVFEALKDKFGYSNVMQAPRIEKVIVNTGVGKIDDKNKLKEVGEKIALITGQAPAQTLAKKSIATFKLREGQLSGYKVTLRGENARDFIDKLINIALPRTRDFRGLPRNSVDEMGNYTLGIKDNSIFPETSDQDVRDAFGFGITIVTSASNKEETMAFLEHLGVPFRKEETE